MKNGTRVRHWSFLESSDFADRVMDWVDEFGPLLDSLVILRLSGESVEAIDALLEAREVIKLRLSWELWEAIISGDGGDAEVLLVPKLGEEMFAWIRLALWGAEVPAPGRLRLLRQSH